MPSLRSLLLPGVLIAIAAGCSSNNSSGGCNPADPNACQNGQVCSQVSGDGTMCAAPVQVSGKVYDLGTTSGIAGARVVALDASQAPLAPASITDGSGNYAITVPSTRNPDGTPNGSITLRADAAGYQTFPSGLRTAIPVALSTAVLTSGTYKATTATNIELIALPAGSYAALHGTVAIPQSGGGALVVATPAAGGASVTGYADKSGAYYVYDVPVAPSGTTDWSVQAYAKGANYLSSVTQPLALASGADQVVNFTIGSTVPYTLTGGLQFTGQNKPPSTVTSVILVVKSTYDAALHRGEAPPGLRDGYATGSGFAISGVPDGDYMVLAAFENDGWVQDTGQGSTGYYEVVVVNGQLSQVYLNGTLQSNQSIAFKITGAVSLSTPFTGTYDSAPWPDNSVAPPNPPAAPTFDWMDYPSSASYDIQVIDSLGNVACSKTAIPYGTTSFTWTSADCGGASNPAPATWYQFIVRAYQTGGALASRSEDLKGVFYTP